METVESKSGGDGQVGSDVGESVIATVGDGERVLLNGICSDEFPLVFYSMRL